MTSASDVNIPASGGERLRIFGTGMTGAGAVEFHAEDGTQAAGSNPIVVSPTEIDVTTPALAKGAAAVEVFGPGGDVQTGQGFVTVVPSQSDPAVTKVYPAEGSDQGGSKIQITGTGFTAGTQVYFGTAPSPAVSVLSPDSLEVTVPADTAASGAADVQVLTPTGIATDTGAFNYVTPPAITGAFPGGLHEESNTTVTIHGHNFTNVADVLFGSDAYGWTPAANFKVLNSTTIQAVALPCHMQLAGVSVIQPGGTATSDQTIFTNY